MDLRDPGKICTPRIYGRRRYVQVIFPSHRTPLGSPCFRASFCIDEPRLLLDNERNDSVKARVKNFEKFYRSRHREEIPHDSEREFEEAFP